MSFVVDVLTGKTYLEPDRNDRTELCTLLNVWRRGQRNDELHAGFVEALTHDKPAVRAGAVMFFARMTTSTDDLDLLHAALTDQTELYDGVREPWFGGADDLRSVLASAVASRATPGHPAVDTLKHEALQPGRAGWVIVALVGLDPVWVRQNAGALITNSPTALDPLLFNLKMRGIDMRAFLRELRQDVDERVIRAGVVSALGDEAPDVLDAVFDA
jgi:CheY-like chemotaxis protein